MANQRLKVGDITIKEMFSFSHNWYRKNDDKTSRMKQDIKNGRVTFRRGLDYNRKTKEWEQTSREVRFEILVKSHPISYKDTSGIDNHYYPVNFLIKDWKKGFNSTFKWRTGSFYKPTFPKKKISEGNSKIEKDKIRKKNKKIQQKNIKNGIQMQWFFEISWTADKWNLLFGPNWASYPPKKTNPDYIPFFDKHSYFIVTKVLPLLFKNPKLNQMFKNK